MDRIRFYHCSNEKGSAAVEVSMLLMVIICVILMCISYVLCLHDKTILEESAQRIAMECSTAMCENARLDNAEFDWDLFCKKGVLWRLFSIFQDENTIRDYLKKDVEGRLLVCSELQVELEQTRGSVEIRYRAKVNLPWMSGMTDWETVTVIAGSAGAELVEQEEVIRLIRGIIGDKRLQDLVQGGE